MDKHERPYKCSFRGCEKILGFTYQGGLSRHQREVHRVNGGPSKELFCPIFTCKRSANGGGRCFTRKENLNEHLRRVHSAAGSTSTDAQDLAESPPRRASIERHVEELPVPRKRKRDTPTVPLDGDDDDEETDLLAVVKRLRKENEDKDDRLRRLEDAVAQLTKFHQSRRSEERRVGKECPV